MEKQRLFVDMDGTLAEFRHVDTLETLYEQGYFLNLAPQQNVVDAVKVILEEHPEIEITILSAVLSDSEYAMDEKIAWLEKHLPELGEDQRIFPPCGADKKDYIPGGIRETDFLLDDYTHNLQLWQPPARGIKLLNGINHTRGTWQHAKMHFETPPRELATNIVSAMQGPERSAEIRELLKDMDRFVRAYDTADYESRYDYNGVAALLTQAHELMNGSLRFPRPAHIPDDMPWSEKPFDPDEEVDPYTYDGSMSPEDYERMHELIAADRAAADAEEADLDMER